MIFNRRVITKFLDYVNLKNHNDNFTEIHSDLTDHESRITGTQRDITTHKASTEAHPADHLTYSGPITGADNIKMALDILKQILDQGIAGGDSGPEARAARISISGETYDLLVDRLNAEYLQKQEQIATVNEQLADNALSIRSFPRLAPEVDDTGRLTRAFNSGYNIRFEPNGHYVSDTVPMITSNITIYGNGATIQAKNKESQILHIGATITGAFTKVMNIRVHDLNLVGVATSIADNLVSAGINVINGVLSRGSGCENIGIYNCSFSKFTFGLIATGVTGLIVEGNFATNNYFCQPQAAGGYGILIQSCFDVWIRKNTCRAVAGDRHAIYISCVKNSVVPNENVNVSSNIIDWSGVSGITGFESCLMLRSTRGLIVSENVGLGGYGAIDIDPSNGDFTDTKIVNNVFNDINAPTINERGGLAVHDNSFKVDGLLISNNTFATTTAGVIGVALGRCSNVTISKNKVRAKNFGMVLNGATKVMIDNNEISDCSSAGIAYKDCADVIVGINAYHSIATQEVVLPGSSPIKNFIHRFERNALIRGTGSGVEIVTDEYKLIKSISGDAYGVKIVFNALFNAMNGLVKVVQLGSSPIYTYNRSVDTTDNSMVIGIKDFQNYDKNLSTLGLELMISISQ